jgi:glycosyltransferase involved in cell wall biosynthesis
MKEILTVVIPCKNEGFIIKKTLILLNQQVGIKGTKVIIADSSTDNCFTFNCIGDAVTDNLNVEVINGGYPAVARNNGAKKAKTKYVLFLDADMFIKDPNLISSLLVRMEQKDIRLLTVKIRTEDGNYNNVYRAFDIIQFLIKFSTPFAVGGFMLFKRKTFNRLGGFNPDDKFAEDYHLSSKVNPKYFHIDKHIVYTLSRRFKNKGVWYMGKLMIKTFLNKNNEKFFQKEYNYWS